MKSFSFQATTISQTRRQIVVRYQAHSAPTSLEDEVAVEEPLEIRIQGKPLLVTMRTPGHDKSLAAGYLWSEGVISKPEHILDLEHCQQGSQLNENVLNVFLHPEIKLDEDLMGRFSYAASGCGLCGKSAVDAIRSKFPPIQTASSIRSSVILQLFHSFNGKQHGFETTGGLHAAALFNAEGHLIDIKEDVGRHNAVDKVIGGRLLRGGLRLQDTILLVTSRASFEIVQKALAAGIPTVAFASAPSSLAIEFAQANGQTLIGFLREERFNAYTHPKRIVD